MGRFSFDFLVALSPCSCLAEALLFLFVFCVWGDEQLSTSTVLTRPEPVLAQRGRRPAPSSRSRVLPEPERRSPRWPSSRRSPPCLYFLRCLLSVCLRLAAQHLAGGEQTHRWLFLSPSPLGTCGSCFPPFLWFFSRFCSAVGVHRLLIVRCTARQCLVPFGGVRCLSKVPAQFPVWQVRISTPVFFCFIRGLRFGFKFHLFA